ncbi:cupin-like domain-containing protein [Stakelama saccharophila]|uniref:Cupin-like domain-containing protein n=1 Tax=Stakelama saccharophila TaxID=3075605 RepID=A0ABZ0BAS1_9SPHN|nr:cupin-like domain-containing protein [Stakelama sp. W311]WNO54302.1 cupin-like domain-containing protein [Stakelama sp. W311]
MAEADPGIFRSIPAVRERQIADVAQLDAVLREAGEPFVVRGLVSDWPLVAAGKQSPRAARRYLLDHARAMKFTVSAGAPGTDGRMFYDAAMGMNFRTLQAPLPEIFARIDAQEGRADAHPIYLASIDMHRFFSGLAEENRVDLGERKSLDGIWIGTPTRIAAHNDFPDNLACVAVGRRRFTLFPPDQFRNLYLGPIDNTPAGRAISMVDFHNPDFERFPKFREALDHALVAEMEPGDALHIPSMWWHHVEGLSSFNVLVNYWWRDTPRWLGQPQNALNLALMAIRDLPQAEKEHWRDLFDHYVFRNRPEDVEHIPEDARSVLAPLTPESAERIRGFLLRQLNQ